MEKPCNSTSGTTDETGNNPPLPIRNPVLSPGFRSVVDRTVEEFRTFQRSAAPRRFLFFEDNSWLDLPDQVFDDLSAGFVAGKTTLEVPVDGNRYIFDFLRMTRIDSSTGARNSIAWIDVEGRRFFPKAAVEEQRKRKRDSGEDSEASSAPNLDRPKWAGGERLGDDDRIYRVVERSFVAGMRRAGAEATVTAVTRCSYSGPLGISRLRGFQMMVQGTKDARGNANVRFGWYGGSVDAIAGVVEHGFGVSDSRDSGFGSRGVGVHLSSPHSAFASSLQSIPDDDGEKHILLCRVIMGNSERVEDGSSQYRPSSSEFDSGVDDLVSPRCYVVWSTHVNTHILPEYIVSFRSPNQAQGLWGAVDSQRRLAGAAAGLSFRDLFAELGRSLPPTSMQALESLYNQHKAGKVSKDAFIRYLRSVAGDDLLTTTIKGIRGHQYDVKRVKRY